MAMINAGTAPASVTYNKGNPRYVFMLTLVATLGSLLFGYVTSVVNGAEKSLVECYISRILLPENYSSYTAPTIIQYKDLMIGVLYVVLLIEGIWKKHPKPYGPRSILQTPVETV